MALYEVEGKVKAKLDVVSGTSAQGKQWSKQDVVIETVDGQDKNGNDYLSTLAITFFGDKVQKLGQIEVNDTVKASFSVKSNEYQGRYFTNVNGVFIDHADKQVGGGYQTKTPDSTWEPTKDDGDDLPF